MSKTIQAALYCATAISSIGLLPQVAAAQTVDAQAQSQEASGSDIVVTARKRDESIVDVPLAISVVSADKLQKLDIKSTVDLANYVPGLQFSDYTPGYARNDRGATRPLIFRGLNVGTGGSVSAAGGMFLDGAAVVGNEIPGSLDIGAVEVLRGPQSVYFGRSTMTGAVSYRTKTIPDHWTMEAEFTAAERKRLDAEVSIAGPIIKDLLKLRLTGVSENSGGYIRNTYDNSMLGDRSRKSASATVEITPANNLDFKGYVNYFHDDDGPSATVFVPATLDNCKATGASQKTFCGQIPGFSNSINYFRNAIPASAVPVIFGSTLIKGQGFDNKLGLQRNAFNGHFIANWQINDYLKLQSITGYHTNVTLQGADGTAQPVAMGDPINFPYSQYVYTITNKSKDFSQELRLSSDEHKMFSWTLGTNYVNASNATNALLAFYSNPANGNVVFSPSYQNIGTDYAKTYGFFGGGYLKLFNDRLTLSAEGRYQIDKRRSQQQTANPAGSTIIVNGAAQLFPYLAPLLDARATFNSFNPRLSIAYNLGGHRSIYASYSTGTRPGGFNTNLYTYILRGIPALTADLNKSLPGTPLAYKEEKLKIGELGIKGNFAGGKGYFDLNGYYGTLNNQQIGYGALIPYLGFSVVAIDNIGQTKVYGVEWQGNYNFTRDLSLSTTFAWNHTDRNKFLYTSGIAQYGTTNLNGVQMANTPQFSGSAVGSYSHEISKSLTGFATVAYVYRGKQFVDTGNLAYIKGRSQVDLRIGGSQGGLTAELFMTNVLNDRNYVGGSVSPDYGSGTSVPTNPNYGNGFFGAVAEPRTVGVRVHVKI